MAANSRWGCRKCRKYRRNFRDAKRLVLTADWLAEGVGLGANPLRNCGINFNTIDESRDREVVAFDQGGRAGNSVTSELPIRSTDLHLGPEM